MTASIHTGLVSTSSLFGHNFATCVRVHKDLNQRLTSKLYSLLRKDAYFNVVILEG